MFDKRDTQTAQTRTSQSPRRAVNLLPDKQGTAVRERCFISAERVKQMLFYFEIAYERVRLTKVEQSEVCHIGLR